MKRDLYLQHDWIGYRIAYVCGLALTVYKGMMERARNLSLSKRLYNRCIKEPKHGFIVTVGITLHKLYSE